MTKLYNRYSINYYGADYTISELYNILEKDGFITPKFQRSFVWNKIQASKFIESLLLGFPVPTLFFAKDKINDKILIIDGQQRLKTIEYFYKGFFPDNSEFKLLNVVEEFNNQSYNDLSLSDRDSLDNSILHCINFAEIENLDLMFHLFERLNTTGTQLTSQEIRNALYQGKLNDLLNDLAQSEKWIKLYQKDENRLYDVELILSFIALHFDFVKYNEDTNQFLNDFMLENRELSLFSENQIRDIFDKTVNLIIEKIGEDAFKIDNKFNFDIFEILTYVISKNLGKDFEKFKEKLLKSIEFKQEIALKNKNLIKRIELATNILEN